MRKITRICVLLILSTSSLLAGNGYKKITEGKWPYEARGTRFSPYITDNWTYTTSGTPGLYGIYFYREGKDSLPWHEEGGIQFNTIFQQFAGTEQLIAYLKASENIYSDPFAELVENNMVADQKYGKMCIRFSRTFTVKLPQGQTGPQETIRDEGYYFIHPSNNKLLIKVHLFRRSVDAIRDTEFGSYMEKFYKNFATTNAFVPKWTFGVNYIVGFGNTDGLYFGYNDAISGQEITVDPGSSMGLNLCVYRRIKSVWVAGGEVGFSSASSLSGTYDNLEAYTSRGVVAELTGGALLFSKFRSRALFSAGPLFYSSTKLDIGMNDPAGPGDATFYYKPAFGYVVNAQYVLVMKKKRGQLVFGFKYAGINFKLDHFKAGGQSYEPNMLDPSYNAFKKVNGSNFALVLCGYQYTID